MHRTTLQIYHSEKALSFQIEALRWVLEGWILLLDSGSTSHAVQQQHNAGLAIAVSNFRSKGILLWIRWWRISTP
jgi:hypothetical protein